MEWINIEDNLPSNNEIVLVCDKFNTFISLGRYLEDHDGYIFQLMHIDKIEIDSQITHWAPLPSLPKD